jgi:RNA polymerase sigma-70 factor, ECF subfamily
VGFSSHSGMEQALLERAKQGDLRAFEQLLAEHVPRVRRFARAMSRSEADADDLAQEALLKAYLALRSYRFQAAFSTWLYRVVRNAFIDHARAAGTRRDAHNRTLGSEDERAADPAPLPDDLLARDQLRTQVWDALRELPLEFRTALVLFDIEGLSHEEVAAVEGVALGTVKSRLSRGRAQLRALLIARGVLEPGNAEPADLVQSRRSTP